MDANAKVDKRASAGTTGRSAWITGAGSGIGRALALRLAGEGWNVAVSARTARDLAGLAAEAPSRIHAFQLDVTDAEATLKTVARIEGNSFRVGMRVLRKIVSSSGDIVKGRRSARSTPLELIDGIAS